MQEQKKRPADNSQQSKKKEVNKTSELEKQLNDVLGEEKTKAVMQDLALVIAKYNLVKSPEICKLLFDYMVVVTKGWNLV